MGGRRGQNEGDMAGKTRTARSSPGHRQVTARSPPVRVHVVCTAGCSLGWGLGRGKGDTRRRSIRSMRSQRHDKRGGGSGAVGGVRVRHRVCPPSHAGPQLLVLVDNEHDQGGPEQQQHRDPDKERERLDPRQDWWAMESGIEWGGLKGHEPS